MKAVDHRTVVIEGGLELNRSDAIPDPGYLDELKGLRDACVVARGEHRRSLRPGKLSGSSLLEAELTEDYLNVED